MDELYPKVMHFFVQEDGKELFDTKRLKKCIVCVSIFFLVLFGVVEVIKLLIGEAESRNLAIDIAGCIASSVILGAMIGASVWFIGNTVSSAKLMGKSARGASFDAAKVRNCPFCGNDYPLEENEWIVTDIRL